MEACGAVALTTAPIERDVLLSWTGTGSGDGHVGTVLSETSAWSRCGRHLSLASVLVVTWGTAASGGICEDVRS